MIRTVSTPYAPALILAEFPHGACSTDGRTFRIWDGFGNAGRGDSWDAAAESLRLAQLAHVARLDALDREAAAQRERLARRVGSLVLGAAALLLFLAGIFEVLP